MHNNLLLIKLQYYLWHVHVSVPEFHLQGVFQIKGMQSQQPNWVCIALTTTTEVLKLKKKTNKIDKHNITTSLHWSCDVAAPRYRLTVIFILYAVCIDLCDPKRPLTDEACEVSIGVALGLWFLLTEIPWGWHSAVSKHVGDQYLS